MNQTEVSSILPHTQTIISSSSNRRDARGLLNGLEYKFKEDGSVNWRGMLKPEHLVFNKQKEDQLTKKYNKPFKELKVSDFKSEELDDSDLLILLSGINYLLHLRGFVKMKPKVVVSSPHYASVSVNIEWIGNFETDFREIKYGYVGNASPDNTYGIFHNYLEPIATNRALARAVRGFLNIEIYSKDEIGPAKNESSFDSPNPVGFLPTDALQTKLTEKKVDFETFKRGYIAKYKKDYPVSTDPNKWNKIQDIPNNDIYILLGMFTETEAKKK